MTPNHGRAGHLVRVTTSQGRELTGFFASAGRANAPTIIYIHGLSGDFDTNFIFDLLADPQAQAVNILATKNSGSGNITTGRSGVSLGYKLGGSAFERFADCTFDIAAWTDFAAAQSPHPITLMGHSLGASKVVHYAAMAGDSRLAAVVLASPADVPGAFQASVGPARFAQFLEMARRLVESGDGQRLMPDDCVIGLLRQRISAETFCDRMAPDAIADVFDFYNRDSRQAFKDLSQITCPVRVLYGTEGELVGPAGVAAAVETLRRRAARAPTFDSATAAGNHWYIGGERQAMSRVLDWTRALAARDQDN